jgi:(p)ppGpp synthase/HD superfamily hydrolase
MESSRSDVVNRAREFAIGAHKNQRYGAHPYVAHLDAVAALVARYGDEAQIVAYLHDIVEDSHVTLAMVIQEFGDRIAELVALVSDEPGSNRKSRKTFTNLKLAAVSQSNDNALIVKAADRLANVRISVSEGNSSKLAMYRDEHPEFRAAVYRPELCDDLWQEIQNELFSTQIP